MKTIVCCVITIAFLSFARLTIADQNNCYGYFDNHGKVWLPACWIFSHGDEAKLWQPGYFDAVKDKLKLTRHNGYTYVQVDSLKNIHYSAHFRKCTDPKKSDDIVGTLTLKSELYYESEFDILTGAGVLGSIMSVQLIQQVPNIEDLCLQDGYEVQPVTDEATDLGWGYLRLDIKTNSTSLTERAYYFKQDGRYILKTSSLEDDFDQKLETIPKLARDYFQTMEEVTNALQNAGK